MEEQQTSKAGDVWSSAKTDKIDKAVAAMQAELTNPPLDGHNPHFKSSYTTLGCGIKAIRPVAAKHGVAVTQGAIVYNGDVWYRTKLSKDGQFLAGGVPMPEAGGKNLVQSLGSHITYLRRFTLFPMVDIAGDDDDDGNSAEPANSEPKRPPKASKATKAKKAPITEMVDVGKRITAARNIKGWSTIELGKHLNDTPEHVILDIEAGCVPLTDAQQDKIFELLEEGTGA